MAGMVKNKEKEKKSLNSSRSEYFADCAFEEWKGLCDGCFPPIPSMVVSTHKQLDAIWQIGH